MRKSPVTVADMAAALHRGVQRDTNPNSTWACATLAGEGQGTGLLIDVADPSGANGARQFIAEVHEVDPPEGNQDMVDRLAEMLAEGLPANAHHMPSATGAHKLAQWLVNRGVRV